MFIKRVVSILFPPETAVINCSNKLNKSNKQFRLRTLSQRLNSSAWSSLTIDNTYSQYHFMLITDRSASEFHKEQEHSMSRAHVRYKIFIWHFDFQEKSYHLFLHISKKKKLTTNSPQSNRCLRFRWLTRFLVTWLVSAQGRDTQIGQI